MSEPSGERFLPSSSVTIGPDVSLEVQRWIQIALGEMDRLHTIPKRSPVIIEQNRKRSEQGSYDPRRPQIFISSHARDPLGTFLHEYAHFLDNRILQPIKSEYASRYEDDFKPFLEACLQSNGIMTIMDILRRHRGRLSVSDALFLRTSIQPHELFARAYLQWVCTASGNLLLQASLASRIDYESNFAGKQCRFQWEHEDFADIMQVFESFFEAKGLR